MRRFLGGLVALCLVVFASTAWTGCFLRQRNRNVTAQNVAADDEDKDEETSSEPEESGETRRAGYDVHGAAHESSPLDTQ